MRIHELRHISLYNMGKSPISHPFSRVLVQVASRSFVLFERKKDRLFGEHTHNCIDLYIYVYQLYTANGFDEHVLSKLDVYTPTLGLLIQPAG